MRENRRDEVDVGKGDAHLERRTPSMNQYFCLRYVLANRIEFAPTLGNRVHVSRIKSDGNSERKKHLRIALSIIMCR